MHRLAIATLTALTLLACSGKEPAVAEPTDTRQPIEVLYVTSPELQVRAQANDNATLIATYQNAEAIPILAKQGDWAEVRTGDRSGWTHLSDLGSPDQAAKQEADPRARFVQPPMPVTNLTARGEVYLEASVNTDGDVTDVRVITNTTGSDSLAAANSAALREAKFYPITQRGEKRPFKYYHKVTY